MPKAASLAWLLAAALAAVPVAAQVLYKWVDDQGKTHYSDQPPKNFKGEVIRIEPEAEKATVPVAAPPSVPEASGKAAVTAPADDIAARRRATRVRLGDQLEKARQKVETTKVALAKAQSPEPDERQVIQQRASGGMHGMAARSNCRVEGTGKTKTLMCPTFVPTPEHLEKVTRLEEEVRKAEEELEEAERAWRRGVD